MKCIFRAILVVLVLLMSIVPAATATPVTQPSDQDTAPPIRLAVATFVPTHGERPAFPPGLTIADYAQNERGYYIVQFSGPVHAEWRAQLEGLGGEIMGYIPDFAYKVRLNPGQAQRAAQLDNVIWVGIYQPAYKLSPDLALDGTHLYRVRVERGADFGLARAAIVATSAELISADGGVIVVAADANQIVAIANVTDVAWVENFQLRQKHNEYGAGAVMGANIANNSGYDGSTQTVAVADTGLGNGTTGGAHAGIPAGRVAAVYNWTTSNSARCYRVYGDGAQDVDSGHGTHVAGSVLGGGDGSGAGKGTAPAARLVFQAVEDYLDMFSLCSQYADGYYLIGIPTDLRPLFQQAYDAGARIHANSWGSDAQGDYTLDSANTDDFIWNNRDMLVTFSAGNAGTDANGDGIVDNDSIGSPATAKNVLTVGASENDRQGNYPCDSTLTYPSHDAYQPNSTCASMGGQNRLGTYGERWGADYPAAPLANDLTAGNAGQMAAFSSRGPSDDGRIKPDVVAPGTWVLSGFSALYQEGYGDPSNPQTGVYQVDGWGMPSNGDYKYFGGTSMSNPLAAGAAAVVRDFYQKDHGLSASAALVKATLINSAVDLLDENNDGADDNDFPIPNMHEGWGRVELNNATDGSHQFIDEAAGLQTGNSATFQYNVTGGALKVSLAWSDYPSGEAVAKNLVNDLDLVVIAPGGAQYRGNVFGGGWSQTGGVIDRINNVENVYIESAEAGTWTVEVKGYNVGMGSQTFALVVDGGGANNNEAPVAGDDSYTTAEDMVMDVMFPGVLANDTDADSDQLTAVFSSGPASGTLVLNSDGSFTYTPSANFNGTDSFTYRATDGTANSNIATVSITVDPVPDAPVAVDDSASTAVATAVVIDVLANDSDGDSDPLSVTNLMQPANGAVSSDGAAVTYTPNGDFAGNDTFTYTAYDGTANSNTATVNVTVQPAATSIHVGDLDASSIDNGKTWDATVTVLVVNGSGNPVSGATVNGVWSNGASGNAFCVTESNGWCSVSVAGMRKNVGSVGFGVTGVSHASLSYDASANRDPDGDSNGTSITVTKP